MKLKIILSISSLFHAFKVQSIEMVFLLFILYRFIIVIMIAYVCRPLPLFDVFNSTRYIISTDVVGQSVAETWKMITRLRCESPRVTRTSQSIIDPFLE